MYEYRASIRRVIDGDTVDVDIDLGFDVKLEDERVRIVGIDTPESRTSDPVEDLFGEAAKARVKELLDGDVVLRTQLNKHGEDMRGKFGRVLGDFVIGNRTLTEILIAEGHAVAYHGQNKSEVEAAHLANRERLLTEGVISNDDYQAAVKLLESKQ